jgi:hypothetical protein
MQQGNPGLSRRGIVTRRINRPTQKREWESPALQVANEMAGTWEKDSGSDAP